MAEIHRLLRAGNYRAAAPKLSLLAQAMNPEAQYLLAIVHRNLAGTATNAKNFIYWLRQSYSNGYAKAAFELGMLADSSFEYANRFIEAHREINDRRAKGYYKKAVSSFRKLAEGGDPEAMYYLGLCYKLGIVVRGRASEGAEWIRKASLAGFRPDSQC